MVNQYIRGVSVGPHVAYSKGATQTGGIELRQVVAVPVHIKMVLEPDFMYEFGTNCWNATKFYFDPNNTPIRHTDQIEMVEWLKANTVEISEQDVRIGDVAVYIRGSLEESDGVSHTGLIHTAVVMTESLKMFHKRGVAGDYEIVSCDEVNETYILPYGSRLTWRRYIKTEQRAA